MLFWGDFMILLCSSTQKAQIGLDVIPSLRQRLRSAVDLIHFDCYTNGINKGRMTILKHWEFVFFIGVVIVAHCDAKAGFVSFFPQFVELLDISTLTFNPLEGTRLNTFKVNVYQLQNFNDNYI